MGSLYLKMAINPSYNTSDFETELLLARVRQANDQDTQDRIDLTLESLSGPLSRLMLGAAMVVQEELVKAGFPGGIVPLCEHDDKLELDEQKYNLKLEIEDRLGFDYNAKKRPVAKLAIVIEIAVHKKPTIADIAQQLDFLEKAVAGMCRDLLIANRVAEPMPEPIVGTDAAELAKALQMVDNAWNIAAQLRDAVAAKVEADNVAASARDRLRELTAELAEPQAPALAVVRQAVTLAQADLAVGDQLYTLSDEAPEWHAGTVESLDEKSLLLDGALIDFDVDGQPLTLNLLDGAIGDHDASTLLRSPDGVVYARIE